MEEAALQGIPAILIDSKGDPSNLFLHFPELAQQNFQPKRDPELARHAGETLEQASNEAALAWRKGQAEWVITNERMLALKNAAEFAIIPQGQIKLFLSLYYYCWPRPAWTGAATARSWANGFPTRLRPN